MRLAVAIILVAALGGCRSRPFDEAPLSSTDGAAPIASADLARPSACAQLLQCMMNCVLRVQDFAAQNCFAQCGNPRMPMNGPFFPDQVGGAAQQVCANMPTDPFGLNMGPAQCVPTADLTLFVDAPGLPAGSCSTCLNDLLANEVGAPCPANHPMCAPSQDPFGGRAHCVE